MFDRRKIEKLANKKYRDSYMSAHVRAGIAYQIEAMREALDLSQIEFASLTEMKQSTVSRLEDPNYGRVNVSTLLNIAQALDVALLVRFCDYREFLDRTSDVSPGALRVDNFGSTKWSMGGAHQKIVMRAEPYVAPYIVGLKGTQMNYTDLGGTTEWQIRKTQSLLEPKIFHAGGPSTSGTSIQIQ